MPKIANFSELNDLYLQADEADRAIQAEQRANILLAYGDHFNQRNSRFWGRLRDTINQNSSGTDPEKLRVVKNHVYRITRTIVNSILSQAPDVAPMPKNERELQDQKAAQLHNSVWQDIKYRLNLSDKIRKWCEDFVVVGEVAVKIYWDPDKGDVVGYQQKVDENGEAVFKEDGSPMESEIPVFSGDICIERVMGFNLLRDPTAKSMDEADCLIIRKMVDIKTLKDKYGSDEDKSRFIQEASHDIYTVYDGSTASYSRTKGKALVREYYYKKSHRYPDGYFYITTEYGVLEQGPLPYGIYPIITAGWDEIQTTPRKRSILKQLKPTQVEINRTASQIATHHVTVGDTKLLIQSGTKVTEGGKLPGVRVMNYSGAKPEYFNGSVGEQFFEYLQGQIDELYQLAQVDKEDISTAEGKLDPYAELFRSIKQKKKYSMYATEFENFLIKICQTCSTIAKYYYPDDRLVPAIGRSEYVNIPEFRAMGDIGHQIKVMPQSEDYETKVGKQITLTNMMQYLGSQLSKEDAGRILRAMPYTNTEVAFNDWTTDYDMATNDMLALDRGEYPQSNIYENHQYMIKMLTNRVKQPDFNLLDPVIQQNYMNKIKEHEQLEAQQMQMMKQAQSEFIPATGPLIKADVYITDPENPTKTSRAKLPMDAVRWLIDQLEKQGTGLAELSRLEQQNQADISQKFLNDLQAVQQSAATQMPPQGEMPVI